MTHIILHFGFLLITLVLPGKLGNLVNLVHQVHVMIGIFYSGQIYLQKHTGCSLKLFLRVCVCQPCVRRRSVKGVSVVVFIYLLQFFHILFSFQFSSSSVFFIFSSVFMFLLSFFSFFSPCLIQQNISPKTCRV